MSHVSSAELSDALDLEFFLDRESLSFRSSRGRSGEQLNLMTCVDCGNDQHRVYLNAETGLGNCFVCGQTFSKLKFIHLYLGHTDGMWGKTFNYLKEVLKDQGWRPKRVTPVAVDETNVVLPLSVALPTKDGQTLAYLRDRGIDDDLTRYFSLRYCQTGWWNFEKPDGGKGGQQFGERVIIPVYDLEGELVTFQGRDITGTAEKKYLFPMGLPGTGRFLYNGQNAVKMKRVVVGEGAFDVYGLKIAIDQAVDLRDIVPVGSFGKNLSYGDVNGADQLGAFLKLKNWGLEEVILCWDGEERALVAALDAAKLLVGIGLKVRIALMPAGKDPNEVSALVTQTAIRQSHRFTPTLDMQWRLRNPYRISTQRQSILTA